MTADLKAFEIFEKMWLVESENGVLGMSRYDAKQCALIAVDEILELLKSEGILIGSYYWNDVRTEIEKL